MHLSEDDDFSFQITRQIGGLCNYPGWRKARPKRDTSKETSTSEENQFLKISETELLVWKMFQKLWRSQCWFLRKQISIFWQISLLFFHLLFCNKFLSFPATYFSIFCSCYASSSFHSSALLLLHPLPFVFLLHLIFLFLSLLTLAAVRVLFVQVPVAGLATVTALSSDVFLANALARDRLRRLIRLLLATGRAGWIAIALWKLTHTISTRIRKQDQNTWHMRT